MLTATQPADCPIYTAPVLFGTRNRLAAILDGEAAAALGLTQANPVGGQTSIAPTVRMVDRPMSWTLAGPHATAAVPPCVTLARHQAGPRW